ncbi:MAG TPA: ABC transporter permease subunit [Acidimicrobiales bacterium]|jgi:ABC-2 type transport system permease protein
MIALLRTEFVKASRRTRTIVVAALLIGLPWLIVLAIDNSNDRRGPGGGPDGLFSLARASGLLVPAPVLTATSSFLLVVIAGLLAGDSVAGDAATGNLRYLLMRPVGRVRLLLAKATVAGLLIWASVLLVVLAALAAGVAVFGAHPVLIPSASAVRTTSTIGPQGFVRFGVVQLSESTVLFRTAIATAYVAFGLTALLALGTLFSTLSDTPTGAISATIGVYIVSEILDSVTSIGTIRYGLPTHYMDAWLPMFTSNQYSSDMVTGVIVQVAYLVVFGTAAALWFRRKDIRS